MITITTTTTTTTIPAAANQQHPQCIQSQCYVVVAHVPDVIEQQAYWVT